MIDTKDSFRGARITKTIIWSIFSVASYVLIFYFMLYGSLRSSLLFVLIFFVCFHFLYLQISTFRLRYLLLILLGLTIIGCAVTGFQNYLLGLAILVINAGIRVLAWYLQGETLGVLRFSSWGFFNVGGYVFTVFITIGYSLVLLGLYQKFPLTCQGLSDASARVVNFFTRPVTDGTQKIKENISSIFNTKVKDIAVVGQDVSLSTEPKSAYAKVVGKINKFKKDLVDQALQDNNQVSMGICDYVLGEVNKRYENPAFLISVVVLLFILLYSFVRIVFRVMAFVGLFLFKILYLCRAYHTKIEMVEAERIE